MNEADIIAIRQKANIVDIISDYIPLTQKGKNYFAVCPFHDDHNPSMVVSGEKQIFNCFTCHTGGNVFTFVMKYENITFPEAVKVVANKIGMNISINSKANIKNAKHKTEYEIMDLSCKYYANILNTAAGVKAKKYLSDRGITEEIIKAFNIGLAPVDKAELYKYLQKQGFNANEIEKTGLINKSGIDIYDAFSNRIMIPISDINGQVVGYTGRIFNNEALAKYVNTKETDIFVKGEIIFNYFNAKKYIRDEKRVYVVEGNMDAIKMYASGVKNVIALMGTAITKEQAEFLKKLHVPIALMLDNDNAGLQATIKNGDFLRERNIDLEVIRLKGYKDPDEYIEKNGVDDFKKIISKPVKYIDFKLDYIKKEYDLTSSEGLVNYIKQVIELLNKEDDITRKVLISKISKENNIDENLFISELKTVDIKEIKPVVQTETKKETKYDLVSKRVLYYMLNDSKYIRIFQDEVGYFEERIYRDIFNEIKHFFKNNEDTELADVLSYFQEKTKYEDVIVQIINSNSSFEINYDSYIDYLKFIKKQNNEQEIKKLKDRIKDEQDIDVKMNLIDKLAKLKKGCVDNGRD